MVGFPVVLVVDFCYRGLTRECRRRSRPRPFGKTDTIKPRINTSFLSFIRKIGNSASTMTVFTGRQFVILRGM